MVNNNEAIRISVGVILAELENFVEQIDRGNGRISKTSMIRKIKEIKKRIIKSFPIKEDKAK